MLRISERVPSAVLLIVACALWGAATVMNKALLIKIPPVSLLVIQLVPSAAVLWIAGWLSGVRFPKRRMVLPLVMLGLLNPGISYTLSLIGLARISASISTLLWAAEPLMVLAIAAVVLKERMTWPLLSVIVVGILGVGLVANLREGFLSAGSDLIGILLLLTAVLCCAFYTVFARMLADSVDPLSTVAIQQTAGAGWAVTLLLADTRYGSVADLGATPTLLIGAAIFSGLLYYAAAYWLYITALRTVPAAIAASYFSVIPVFGVGLALLFLGETLTTIQWAGAGTILLSVVALVKLTRDEAPDASRRNRSRAPA
jgi:drug/metabolite transporter (DMT)-like permease